MPHNLCFLKQENLLNNLMLVLTFKYPITSKTNNFNGIVTNKWIRDRLRVIDRKCSHTLLIRQFYKSSVILLSKIFENRPHFIVQHFILSEVQMSIDMKYFSIQELAQRGLGSESKIKILVASGKIKSLKIGRSCKRAESDLDEYIKSCQR